MITIYIPGLAQKSYEYRRGDAQIIHDDNKNAIVIDGGESDLSNKLIAYCRNKGITHITYILTHWHCDHDAGMKAFLDVSGICVDKIYCPPPSEIKNSQESGHTEDYNRANRRISLAKSLNKPIVYPPAGSYTDVKVGDIRVKLWRRSCRTGDQNDREINNTSIQAYFPDLWYLSGGDMIDKGDFLKTKPGTVVVMKGYHHGNGDGSDLQTLKTWGVKLYWYNNWEPKGKAIGSTSFSKWGAGKAVGLINTVLRTDSDIIMTAANKTLKVQKGSQAWSFPIPYGGKVQEGWFKGTKGWWYQFADGSYAVGWKKLKWSQGESWFYFNQNGWMLTGWVYTGGFWYYLNPSSGAMQTGWIDYKGKRCYLEPVAGKNQGHAYCNETATIDGKTYRFDRDCYAAEITTGGKYPRADIVSLAQSFVGTKEGGTIHHRIIDKYNEHRPLPRGYKVTYTDAWCATFCSYLAIASGYTDIIPIECGCPQWVTIANSMGIWVESDNYRPRPGDFILYDWQDSGSGDNTGTPDHIGIVEKIDGQTVTVIEGNYNDSVKRRQIQIGGKYIRGYVTPKYSD